MSLFPPKTSLEKLHRLDSGDQPCLAADSVNHPEEPILLLAHADRHKLRKAVDAVVIEYEPLPPVHTIEESEQKSTIIWGADNTFKNFSWKRVTLMRCGKKPRMSSRRILHWRARTAVYRK